MHTFASLFITALVLSLSLWGASPVLAQDQDQGQGQSQSQSNESEPGEESVLPQEESSETEGYLTVKPDKAFYADDLIGNSVMTKRDAEDQEIGPISDLVIDEFGQIVALVVGAGSGGFMGMGVKEIAIPWQTIELARKEGEDRYTVYTDVDVEALKDAPEFDKD